MESNKSCRKFRSVTLLLFLIALVGIISCEGKKSQTSASKTNSPPVIISATILPEKPTKGSELSLSIQSKDPEGDPITYQYQWIKNDDEEHRKDGVVDDVEGPVHTCFADSVPWPDCYLCLRCHGAPLRH